MKTFARIGSWVAPLLLATLLTGCSQERTALVFGGDVADDWEKAYNAGDADAIAALLTDDALVMPPNSPAVEGRSAIKAFYREQFANRVVPAKTDEREVIVFGEMTYRQGVYALALPDGSTEYGKFVELWKNDNGQWRLHRSIWSSNGSPDQPSSSGQTAAADDAAHGT